MASRDGEDGKGGVSEWCLGIVNIVRSEKRYVLIVGGVSEWCLGIVNIVGGVSEWCLGIVNIVGGVSEL